MYEHGEPRATGMLDVGDGNLVFWQESGNPHGKPALVVHGGPGSGCGLGSREFFDPERYRLIMFDQRGCGRSEPHASDPGTDLTHNTTHHLIADMELLREHLSVDRWLLSGGSWGSTLALAYAEEHPERVSEIVLSGATISRHSDVDWITDGIGVFFPEALERFRAGAGNAENVVAAYAKLMEHPDFAVRDQAAKDWTAWEDTVISLEPNGNPTAYSDRPTRDLHALVRLVTHYWSHHAWLADGQILRESHRLHGIPGAIIHGRHDIGGPVEVAWTLARAWPDAELIVVEDSGHTGSDQFYQHKLAVLDRFASR
ncbi:prolyl aminopeptidase [Actinokineospora inagensis]|uniref:prolyl aminopeptidase n=1 Tax=Actinokineospora inagensis TaxID=103730 RepID=UPI000400171A|nr:prolyl aminopeptidase [Actinokineospora inagensis]